MAKYRLRVHIRVMNHGQWDVLDDLTFSDEIKSLIGDVSSYVDGRSLVINKIVSYSGFLFISPFLEIIETIRNYVGECLAIGDYVEQSDRGIAAYICEIGKLSEFETSAGEKLLDTSISDIKAWVKARDKSTPQSVLSVIKTFYEKEPQPTMQGPWSIEKEIELRHNVFSKADFDEIVKIAKANMARIYHILGGVQQSHQIFVLIAMLAGQIGAANGRRANAAEKKLYSVLLQGLPDNLLDLIAIGIEKPFDNAKLDAIQKLVDTVPSLCPSIIDLIFCVIYADGKAEPKEKSNLQKLCEIFSMPMSAMYMAMQLGEELSDPPIDYVAYISSAAESDTAAYMAASNGFMNIELGGQNMGARVVCTDLPEDGSPVNINLNTNFTKTLHNISEERLSRPTYKLGKTEKVDGLYFGVPDQCSSLSELTASNDISQMLSRTLKEKFIFLAVPNGYEKNAEAYQDLPLSIHCKKNGISEDADFLASIWEKTEKERKKILFDLTKEQLDSNGFGGFPVIYKSVDHNFAIVYAQVGKGEDDCFWCSYMISVFYKSKLYSFMIYINAEKDEKLFSKIVEDWVSTISTKKSPASPNTTKARTASAGTNIEHSNDELETKSLCPTKALNDKKEKAEVERIAQEKAEEKRKKLEREAEKKEKYDSAMALATNPCSDNIESAIKILESISKRKYSSEIDWCNEKVKLAKEKEKLEKKLKKENLEYKLKNSKRLKELDKKKKEKQDEIEETKKYSEMKFSTGGILLVATVLTAIGILSIAAGLDEDSTFMGVLGILLFYGGARIIYDIFQTRKDISKKQKQLQEAEMSLVELNKQREDIQQEIEAAHDEKVAEQIRAEIEEIEAKLKEAYTSGSAGTK